MTERPLRATVSQRGVVFTPDDEVLLVRRESDGEWELPGGRLGREEDAREGVRREVVEETGLDPDLGQPVHVTSWINDAAEGRFAVYTGGAGRVPRGRPEIFDFRDDENLRFSNDLPPRVKAVERLSRPQFVQVRQSETHKDGLQTVIQR